jgi:hypothetical protein
MLIGHTNCELTGNITLSSSQYTVFMRLVCRDESVVKYEKILLTGTDPIPCFITLGNGIPSQVKNASVTWSANTSKMWTGVYSEAPLTTGVNLVELGYNELRKTTISINSDMQKTKILDYGSFNDNTIPRKYNSVRMWNDIGFTDLLVCNTYIPENKQFNELSVLSFLRNLFD